MNFLNRRWMSLCCAVINAYICMLQIAFNSWLWAIVTGFFAVLCFYNFLNQK